MSQHVDPIPTGECFCGCGKPTGEGSFFVLGHDKKAEGWMTRITYGLAHATASRVVAEGYGPNGRNLAQAYEQAKAQSYGDFSARRMEALAIQSLNEVASRPGIGHAVVFIGPPGVSWKPTPGPIVGLQPRAANILEIPLSGSIVTLGFERELSDSERLGVTRAYQDRPAMWASRL